MYCEKCGKYSGKYPLCKDCYYEENVDYIEDIDDEDYENDEDTYIYPGDCLLCGSAKLETFHVLCPDCYKKYRNKELLISITNGKDVTIKDESYYAPYRCKDGHFVRSKAEREIDNYLNDNHIRHYYEYEFSLDGTAENTVHPDFYLPDKDVYIEHWGKTNNEVYQAQIEYKVKIYKKANLTIICTYEETDSKDIEASLNKKLKNYQIGKINYLEK